jgi:hypothetical protein
MGYYCSVSPYINSSWVYRVALAFYLELAREKIKTNFLIKNIPRATYYSRATGWARMRCIVVMVLVQSLGNTRLFGRLIWFFVENSVVVTQAVLNIAFNRWGKKRVRERQGEKNERRRTYINFLTTRDTVPYLNVSSLLLSKEWVMQECIPQAKRERAWCLKK